MNNVQQKDLKAAEAALETLKGWVPKHMEEDLVIAVKTGNLADRSTEFYVRNYVLDKLDEELQRFIEISKSLDESIIFDRDSMIKTIPCRPLVTQQFDDIVIALNSLQMYIRCHRLKH